jgi:hypothetical protein
VEDGKGCLILKGGREGGREKEQFCFVVLCGWLGLVSGKLIGLKFGVGLVEIYWSRNGPYCKENYL